MPGIGKYILRFAIDINIFLSTNVAVILFFLNLREKIMERRNFLKMCALVPAMGGNVHIPDIQAMDSKKFYREPAKDVPIVENADVIVCGGGPAGIGAALASARQGANTTLLELKGSLGGVWTVGLVNCILDSKGKTGIMIEILDELKRRNALFRDCIDPEITKLLLEEMCMEAGVKVRYHTRVVAAVRDNANRLSMIITESKAGRQAWSARTFIDCTGDGDLAAQAGCGFDIGHPDTGKLQPMSMLAFLSGIGDMNQPPFTMKDRTEKVMWLHNEIKRGGHTTSYTDATFYGIRENLTVIMANHEYNVNALDPDEVTRATLHARREVHEIVRALRSLGGRWRHLSLVATPEQIGIRECRRIHGRYMLTVDDVMNGARFDDAVCRAAFPIDVHSLNPEITKGIAKHGLRSKPYDIPVRSLIAKDVDGLMMAGRNISGDFYAHASYRVTGNAVPMGEAAGKVSAIAALSKRMPHEVSWSEAKA